MGELAGAGAHADHPFATSLAERSHLESFIHGEERRLMESALGPTYNSIEWETPEAELTIW
jgi:hypothetical protein